MTTVEAILENPDWGAKDGDSYLVNWVDSSRKSGKTGWFQYV